MIVKSKSIKFKGWLSRNNLLGGILAVGLLVALFWISSFNYLLFHGLAELFSIVVAGGIFVVFWNVRDYVENNFYTFISVAFLFVGLIDLLHTLSYKGMGVFPNHDANLPTQLWIAARYLQSLSFLAATLFLRRKFDGRLIWTVYATLFILLIIAIFLGVFPDCFVEGQGLTPFKITSEYLISLILLGTIWRLVQKKEDFDPGVLRLLIASLCIFIIEELAFTFYINVYGFSNYVGHIFKIISFYLIYQALIRTGLSKPYDLLFRKLKIREAELEASEEKYYNLFTFASDSIFILHSEDLHILDANQNAALRLGYKRDELLQLSFHDIDTNPDSQRIQAITQELQEMDSSTIESFHQRKDGTEITVEITIQVVEYGGHRVFQSFVRDITERKRAEEVTLVSEARYRELFKNIPSGVAVYEARDDGEDFVFVDFNQSGERIDDIRKADLIGKSVLQIYPGINEFGLLDVFQRVWKTGLPEHIPVSLYQDERMVGWRENFIYKLPSGEIVAVYDDRTQEKQAEAELREMHEQLEGHAADLEQRVIARTQEIETRVQQVEKLNKAMTNLLSDLQTNQIHLINAQADLESAHQMLIQERVVEQATLLRFSQELLIQNEISPILDWVVREIATSFDVRHAVIALVAADSQNYTHLARCGWSAKAMSVDNGNPFDAQNDFGQALLSRSPLLISDWELFADLTPSKLLKGASIQASLIVPMIVDEQPMGVMAVNSVMRREWSEDEVRLLTLIANTTAQALERARLFEQIHLGRERLQTLSRRLVEVQENERHAIARDLHDQIGQILSALKLNLQLLAHNVQGPEHQAQISEIVIMTENAIQRVRGLSRDLRPSVLDDFGLESALRWHLDRQSQWGGFEYRFESKLPQERLPENLEIVCYRITQVALTNIIQHAQAKQVDLKIWIEGDSIQMEILDDGVGFDVPEALDKAAQGETLGLLSMIERAELLGGHVEIKSEEECGTSIICRLPLDFNQPLERKGERRAGL